MDSVSKKRKAGVQRASKDTALKRKRVNKKSVQPKRKRRTRKNLFKSVFSNKLVLGLIVITVCFFATLGVLNFTNSQGKVRGDMDAEEPQKIVPEVYTNPVVASWGLKTLSIQPTSGEKVRVKKKDTRYIYEKAYKNTDVIQTVYPYKIKEQLVFYKPDHPITFKYKLGNWESYIIDEDDEGNIIFYDKQNYEETKKLARIFTIPAPYVEDKVGRRSFKAVTTVIDEENLTISVDRKWLKTAIYPVVLDPTVEINVLNVQSYPAVGGEWKIEFTTQGKESLTITGMSHDEYKTVFGEDVEFKFLQCGQQKIRTLKQGNGYLAGSWECADKGVLTVKVLKPGKHHLQFDFGEETADAYNSTWLSGWDYRKSFHIDSSSDGALTNYQKKITVHYGSGTDSGIDVYTSSNCKTDFGDIRYTQSDGNTLLDYYLVQKIDSDKAVFFVELNSIPASGGADFYIYYGKSDATTASNGSSTFDDFEDFETTSPSIDTNGNVGITLSRQNTTVKEGSYATQNSGSQGYKLRMDNDVDYDIDDYIVEGWILNETGSGNERLGPGIFIAGADGQNNGYQAILDNRGGAISPQLREAWNYNTRQNGNYAASVDTWYVVGLYRDNGTTITAELWTESAYYGLTPVGSASKSFSSYGSGHYGISTYNQESSIWDAIWVRKRTENEPAYGDWGEEKTANSAPTISGVSDIPDPVVAGNNVTFSVDWDDSGDNIKAKICKTDNLTNQNCDDGFWATSTDFTADDPEELIYTTQTEDVGSNNYYAFVCDDEGVCSSSDAGAFIVNLEIEASPEVKGYLKSGTIRIQGGKMKIYLADPKEKIVYAKKDI